MKDNNSECEIRHDLIRSTEEKDMSYLADVIRRVRSDCLDTRLIGYCFAEVALLRSETTFSVYELPLWLDDVRVSIDKILKSFEFEPVKTGYVLGIKKHLPDKEFVRLCEAYGIDQGKYSCWESEVVYQRALKMFAGDRKIRRYVNRL